MQRLIIDLSTGEMIDARPLGGVVHFKSGGGSQSTTQIDYAYNARMAAIAESQQFMAEEYFMFWENYYKPMEQAMIEANKSLIGDQTAAEKERIKTEMMQLQTMQDLLPEEAKLRLADMQDQMERLEQNAQLRPEETKLRLQEMATSFDQLKANQDLIPHEVGLRMQQIATEQQGLGLKQQQMREVAPVMSEFYKQALSGVNVDERVSQAQAGVRHSFAQQQQIDERNLARRGVMPSSGVATQTAAGRGIEEAKAVAGAGTAAKTQAEAENFQRLSGAMGFGIGG
jgi:hypothetical protein